MQSLGLQVRAGDVGCVMGYVQAVPGLSATLCRNYRPSSPRTYTYPHRLDKIENPQLPVSQNKDHGLQFYC